MKRRLTDQCLVHLHKESKSTREIIQEAVSTNNRWDDDERFFVCDIGDIIKKVQMWTSLMPRVRLYYAVKGNSDVALLQVLSDMGTSFDCASKKEIETVLNLGVSPTRIVYAHPCKPVSSLIFVKRRDVSLMKFDSVNELHKVKKSFPSARLLLRILPEQEVDAKLMFGSRYGCSTAEVGDILQLAKDLNLNVVGVCFHIGSDIRNPSDYGAIFQQSRTVFDIARTIGFNMNILDIGGGFPGETQSYSRFKQITEIINKALLELFPPEDNVEIIAEPGRYIAASAYTAVNNIIGKRYYRKDAEASVNGDASGQSHKKQTENVVTYFVNDSVFGNFLNGHLNKSECTPKTVKSIEDKAYLESKLLGFTLAPEDCLNRSVILPDLEVGDWLYYEDMGAYTLSMATPFNGMCRTAIKYHCLEELWYQVYPN